MEVDDVPHDKTIRDGNAENINGNSVVTETSSPAKKIRQFIVDPLALTSPREGMEIDRYTSVFFILLWFTFYTGS
jgi:hypothetical protein